MCRLSHDTLEGWARFYSIWCLIVGLLVGLSYCFVLIFDTIVGIKTELYVRILSVVCALLGLSYALAGLLMLLGYRQVGSRLCLLNFDEILICRTGGKCLRLERCSVISLQ